MRIYWNQIRVGRRTSVDDIRARRLSLSTADLRVRGFSVLPQSTVGVQSLTPLHATVWADI